MLTGYPLSCTLGHSVLGIGNGVARFLMIAEYATYRYLRCVVNVMNSNPKLITVGVPQGSVLGPLLFLLYINDFPKITSLKTILFADDTALFASDMNSGKLEKLVNVELEKVKWWLIQNKLTLNIKKSCHIVFGKKDINLNLVIDNDQLIQKDVTKYLGLQIDQH